MNHFFIYISKEGNSEVKNLQIATRVSDEISARRLVSISRFVDRRVAIFITCVNPEISRDFVDLQETPEVVSAAEGYLYNRQEVCERFLSIASGATGSDAELMTSSIRQESTRSSTLTH